MVRVYLLQILLEEDVNPDFVEPVPLKVKWREEMIVDEVNEVENSLLHQVNLDGFAWIDRVFHGCFLLHGWRQRGRILKP